MAQTPLGTGIPVPPPDETQPDELARWHGLAADVRRRLGAGAGLESRPAFEGVLGADLSHVLVHRTPFAGRIAAAAQAEAVTVGGRILGSAERLDAGTRRGSALLAHEAAHAVQAGRATPGATGAAGGGVSAAAVQRAEGGEAEAQAVEASILEAQSARRGRAAVDPEAVAERVYQRLRDDLRLERERLAWPA
jgi:hypothetical protein